MQKTFGGGTAWTGRRQAQSIQHRTTMRLADLKGNITCKAHADQAVEHLIHYQDHHRLIRRTDTLMDYGSMHNM